MHALSFRQLVSILTLLFASLLAASVLSAWSGPKSNPPQDNVAAPINVGSAPQVKDGALSLNALAVFGNTVLNNTSNSNSVTYLNFGGTVLGNGYGFRDNDGMMEYKNEGGTWKVFGSGGGGDGGADGIGYGQSWQNLTSQRKSGVTYTNSTGKPIMVALTCNLNGGFTATIGGVVAMRYPAVNTPLSPSFIVPVGATYSMSCPVAIISWGELR